MLDQLNLALWSWIEALKDLRRTRILAPFLLFFLVQCLVILLIAQFHRPLVSWFMVPLLTVLEGKQVLHYPQSFLFLPETFSRFNIAVDLLVGSFVFAAAYLTVWKVVTADDQERPWSDAAAFWGKMLLLRIPMQVLVLLIVAVVPALFATGGREVSGNALRVLRYGSLFGSIVVEALFAFTPLYLLVERRGLGESWLRGFAMSLRLPLATLLVVMVPNLAQLLIGAVLRRSDMIVQKLAPEMVGWVLVLVALLYVGMNYFITASVVRIYGARGVEEGGGQ